MKFSLTYEGSLPSAGNKPKPKAVWEIRKHFHPQLLDLWSSHPALREVLDNRHFPKTGGASLHQTHHLYPGPIRLPPALIVGDDVPGRGIIDLCEPIEKGDRKFIPLIRESFALHCGLKIKFLRKEPPGRVYQGGDIDGRIKTLFDALTVPQHAEQIIKDEVAPDPLFCLLEEDELISGLDVESERLWGAGTEFGKDYVRLLIEVDIRVRQARIYNQAFLG